MPTYFSPNCTRPGGKRCERTPVPLEAVAFEWDGPAKGRKAVSLPAQKRIWVDQEWYDGLPYVDGRRAILAHERAHLEGAECERCADWGAGIILRQEGVPVPRDALRTMRAALDNRDPEAAEADVWGGFNVHQLDAASVLENLTGKTVTGYRNSQPVALSVYEVEPGRWLAGGAAQAYLRAKSKAAAAGVTMSLESAFRTQAEQQALYDRYKDTEPGRAAKPGTSNHQQGTGLDVASRTTAERERAMTFLEAEGFVRLPSEAWHVDYKPGVGGSAVAGGVGLALLLLAALLALS